MPTSIISSTMSLDIHLLLHVSEHTGNVYVNHLLHHVSRHISPPPCLGTYQYVHTKQLLPYVSYP